jgi:hypothetical protein
MSVAWVGASNGAKIKTNMYIMQDHCLVMEELTIMPAQHCRVKE